MRYLLIFTFLFFASCQKEELKEIELNDNPFDESYTGDCGQITILEARVDSDTSNWSNPSGNGPLITIDYLLNCKYAGMEKDKIRVLRDGAEIRIKEMKYDTALKSSVVDPLAESGKIYDYQLQLFSDGSDVELPKSKSITVKIP